MRIVAATQNGKTITVEHDARRVTKRNVPLPDFCYTIRQPRPAFPGERLLDFIQRRRTRITRLER
jgi:hypothetical protein